MSARGPGSGAPSARTVEMAITSEIGNVSLLGLIANKLAEAGRLAEIERYHVELCIVEAATNVVVHAYLGEPGHRIGLTASLDAEVLRFRLHDTGRPIPEDRRGPPPDPGDSEEGLLREGGRGLFLIHSLMDLVEYRAGASGNELLLEKRLPKAGQP